MEMTVRELRDRLNELIAEGCGNYSMQVNTIDGRDKNLCVEEDNEEKTITIW